VLFVADKVDVFLSRALTFGYLAFAIDAVALAIELALMIVPIAALTMKDVRRQAFGAAVAACDGDSSMHL